MENYFEKLSRLNVSEHLERKGQFAYLSWPYAVEQLRLADPAATWEVRRFEGMPYLKSECGFFVPGGHPNSSTCGHPNSSTLSRCRRA